MVINIVMKELAVTTTVFISLQDHIQSYLSQAGVMEEFAITTTRQRHGVEDQGELGMMTLLTETAQALVACLPVLELDASCTLDLMLVLELG